jgi:hypothetical protein
VLESNGGERRDTNRKQAEWKRNDGVEMTNLPLSTSGPVPAALSPATSFDVLVSFPATLA